MFISHDLKVIRAVSHDIAVMQKGKIIEFGSSREIFSDAKETYTRTLIEAALEIKINDTESQNPKYG